jgi:hypothetical protein
LFSVPPPLRNVDLSLARVPETMIDDDINIEIFLDDPHFVAAGASNPWARRAASGV